MCSIQKLSEPIKLPPMWYVAHCEPFKETAVATAIDKRLGYEIYLPMVNRIYRGRFQLTPFFPCYIFVQVEPHAEAISAINSISGVIRVLSFDGQPQAVPTVVIEGIRDQVNRINALGGLPSYQFKDGESVRITAGPLEGLEAVFLRPMSQSERVKVMIGFLGNLREAEVPVSALEKVGFPPTTKRPRRTRGRGRRIKALSAQV